MESIQSILQQFETKSRLQVPIQNAKLQEAWKTIVGEYIATRTEKVFVKEKKLFIKIPYSIIKNEIRLTKETVLEKTNALIHAHLVDIVFL